VISTSQDQYPISTPTKTHQKKFNKEPPSISQKIKEIILQEFPIFKAKFFQPLRYWFLASGRPQKAYSKEEIKKIGSKLAIERQITGNPQKILWVYSKVLPGHPKEKYTGFLINKKREGYGRIVHRTSNSLKYEGEFKNGFIDGKNLKIYHPNENLLYEGELSEGKRLGFGRLYWDNGKVVYQGNWADDCPENSTGEDIVVWHYTGEIAYQGFQISTGSGDG